jgi:hypothetical protein
MPAALGFAVTATLTAVGRAAGYVVTHDTRRQLGIPGAIDPYCNGDETHDKDGHAEKLNQRVDHLADATDLVPLAGIELLLGCELGEARLIAVSSCAGDGANEKARVRGSIYS